MDHSETIYNDIVGARTHSEDKIRMDYHIAEDVASDLQILDDGKELTIFVFVKKYQ